MRWLRLFPIAALAGALSYPRVVAASPAGRLVYSRAPGAESCADEASLRRAVAKRVGYDPFFPWAQKTVVASMERHHREFVATVSLVDEQGLAHGGRQLRTSGSCAELLDAAALAIAIAIDPEILTRPPGAPSPEPPPPAIVPPIVPPAPIDPPVVSLPPPPALVLTPPEPTPKRCRAAFQASLGAVASFGFGPSIAAGVGAGTELRWCNASVALEGQANAPSTRSAEGERGRSVTAWSVLGAVVPCAHFGPFLVCAVAQGGALRASSEGVAAARTTWAGTIGVGGRVGVLVPITETAFLRVRSDWLANLDPVRLTLGNATVWTAPRVESTLGIDMGLRFR